MTDVDFASDRIVLGAITLKWSSVNIYSVFNGRYAKLMAIYFDTNSNTITMELRRGLLIGLRAIA